MDEQVHVFVLKLWCEQPEAEAANRVWRGSIENAVTRHVVYVNDLAELTAFLQDHMVGPAPESDPQVILPKRARRSVL